MRGMDLDIRKLLNGIMATEYDDPSFMESLDTEEADIRRLNRRCRYPHHSRPV